MNRNPFIFQEAITEPSAVYFRDTRAVDRIVNGLLLGNYYTVIGPRLSGTTSMTWDLMRTASEREKHCRCLYVDLQMLAEVMDESSLFNGIVKIGQWLPPEPAWPWSDVTGSSGFRKALLDPIRGQPARLIVAFDNLDAETLPMELIRLLIRCGRVLYNQRLTDPEYYKISILISGSQNPYALSTGSGSPFNIAERYWLRDLTPWEIEQLIRVGQQISGIAFDDAAIARIATATEGDKYFIQRICHLCVQGAWDEGSQAVTQGAVEGTIERLTLMDYGEDRCFASLVRVLMREADLVEILVDLLEGKEVIGSECQADVNKMQLSGVLKVVEGKLRFRNEVYERFLSHRREIVRDGWRIHAQAKKLIDLHEVTLGIASALNPESIVREAAWSILGTSQADVVAIYLLDRTADRFYLEEVANRKELGVIGPVLERDEHAREAYNCKKSVIVEDQESCTGCAFHTSPCSCIWLPLAVGNDALGTMVITYDRHQDFSGDTLAIEILASYLATAIIRTKMIEALQTVGGIDITGTARDEILQRIADSARTLLNVPVALIWGFEEDYNLRVVAYSGTLKQEYVQSFSLATDVEPIKSFLGRDDPLFLKDLESSADYMYKSAAKEMGWHTLLSMPLKVGDRPIGIIDVYTYKDWEVTALQMALLKLLANQAAVAIENTQLYQQQIENAATLASLYQISTTLRTSLNPEDVLAIVTDNLQRMFDLTTCTIGLLDEAEEVLDFVAYRGLEGPIKRLVKDLPPDLWHTVRTEKQRILREVSKSPKLAGQLERQDLKSFAVLPLHGKGKFLGILTMGSTERLELDERDWDLITALANQAAVTIENAQLFEEVRQARKDLEDSLNILTHQLHDVPGFVTNTVANLLAGKLGELNEKQRDRLEKAQRRLSEHYIFIKNVDMFGRIKRGKIMPRRETIALVEITRGVIDAYRSEARQRGLNLKAKRLRALPPLEADKGMVEVILRNLLDNAVKFTPSGGYIRIETWADAYSLHVAVDDTGPGIPEAERERVFDEYYRVRPVTPLAEKGAGLGLYIAKRLVELHQGHIAIVDKEGPGTRVEVALPR